MPEELRREIDQDRSWRGESLAEYARQAMKSRTEQGKKVKVDLKKLAEKVVGSSTRSLAEAKEWARQVRDDRRLEDEHWEKRWEEVTADIKKNKGG